MPITLVPTAGDSTANSYASVAEADARAAWRLVSPLAAAWAGSSDTERKKSALISATFDIDSLPGEDCDFVSERNTTTQSLQFPRADTGLLPANLVAATIELAFTLLPLATSEPLDTVVNDRKRVQAGDVEVEYFAPTLRGASSIERWPAFVQRLMSSLIECVTEGAWGSATIMRVA